MVFVAVEALPVESKSPAAVGERMSKDGRHTLGAAAPFSSKTSSLQGRSGGSAIIPKLVELVFGQGIYAYTQKLRGATIFQSDNGSEFKNSNVRAVINNKWSRLAHSRPYSPRTNGDITSK